jgi:hypothetical protein
MKKCPRCGFEPAPTNRQLLKLYKKEFGSIPAMEMIERGWLGEVDKFNIPQVEAAILKFFGVTNEDELWELLSKPLGQIVKGVI